MSSAQTPKVALQVQRQLGDFANLAEISPATPFSATHGKHHDRPSHFTFEASLTHNKERGPVRFVFLIWYLYAFLRSLINLTKTRIPPAKPVPYLIFYPVFAP